MTTLGTVTLGTVAAVAAGAAVGAPLRYLVDRVVTDRVIRSAADRSGAAGAALFPWGLLVVNVLGSLMAGIVIAATSGDLRMLLLVGFCGAFTTFSGFAWETDRLWPDARPAVLAGGRELPRRLRDGIHGRVAIDRRRGRLTCSVRSCALCGGFSEWSGWSCCWRSGESGSTPSTPREPRSRRPAAR